MTSTIVVLAIVAFIVIGIAMIYNKLITLQNIFKNAYAQIDVQLKRRYDLVPNLVEAAKAYMKHERETLEAVISARNQAADARAGASPTDMAALAQLAAADSTLMSGLHRLFALAEAYPELKADQQMTQLTEELRTTENRIAFARQAYNDSVMEYNNAIQYFPNVVVATLCSFQTAILLKSTTSEEERKTLRVSF